MRPNDCRVLANRPQQFFGKPVSTTQDVVPLDPSIQPCVEAAPPTTRRGLSPFLLARNKEIQNLRALKERPLTRPELDAAKRSFKEKWDSMADRSSFIEAYEEWRRDGEAPQALGASQAKQYRSVWGGGCKDTPISPLELLEFWTANGWPKDSEMNDGDASEQPAPTSSDTFSECASCDPWGWGRMARNIDMTDLSSLDKYNMIESGLFNYLEWVDRDKADSGEMMMIIVGRSAVTSPVVRNDVVIVSGVCYNPKVHKCRVEWLLV